MDTSKYVVMIFFMSAFIMLMLFYGYAYPIVPFWGDDWQHLASYPRLTMHDDWIPTRILPKYLQVGIGIIANYVVSPLSGYNFLDSIALSAAIVLSVCFVAFIYIIYRIAFFITKHRINALISCSVFLLGIFITAKSKMMPLLLPADLNAQGMGYLLTMACWYVLPYVLNLCFIGLLFIYQINHKRLSFNATFNRIIIGGGATAYLLIFSMESAAFILACYAGVNLFIKIILAIKNRTFRIVFIDILFSWILILWIIALVYAMKSGRADYCGNFDIMSGIAYLKTTFKSIRGGFWTLFFVVLFFTLFDKSFRNIALCGILWICIIIIFFTLTVSRCGATWYLMSGIFLAMLFVESIFVVIILKRFNTLNLLIPIIMIIAFLQSFEPFKERPRVSYAFFKSHSQNWIDLAKQADKQNKKELTIYIPKDFPHYHWESWFFPAFSKTLKNYGLIHNDLNITFKPQE